MKHYSRHKMALAPMLAPLLASLMTMAGTTGIAMADVKAGVDAWAQGDYAKAIQDWTPLAQAGDPDAQFNLGQAYKLGRGVPLNLDTAMEYYRKAAAQGHSRAEDNYGLLLFQQNRRVEAMPYVQRSAERGEPRAEYLYGIAMFNGDLAPKDWVKAYAMMSLAAKSNLPQATSSLAQMNQYIPQDQRLKGTALAEQMEKQQLAAAATSSGTLLAPAAPVRQPPRTLASANVPPSQPAAGATPPPPPAKIIKAPTASKPEPKPATAAKTKPAPAPAKAATGKWRVQLGAFGEQGGADRMWKSMSAKVSGLSSYQRYMVKSGNVTRLLAGPFATRSDAAKLCSKIKAAGGDCLVKPQ